MKFTREGMADALNGFDKDFDGCTEYGDDDAYADGYEYGKIIAEGLNDIRSCHYLRNRRNAATNFAADNIPEPFSIYGDSDSPDNPSVFFLTVFSGLKQIPVVSRKTGEPVMERMSRTWGWFASFAEAYRIVAGNITDIEERLYDYALIEQVPAGISAMNTRRWWWKWDDEPGQWLKSVQPEDMNSMLGLSIG